MTNSTKKDKGTEFKIGMWHSKILTKKDPREYKIRNNLFLIGKLRLVKSRKENIDIRLVAYEMPIKRKNGRASRDNCVDLFGYDREYRPYIIELKKADSNDRMEERIFKEELDSYTVKFKKVRRKIESAVQEAYFLKKFAFKGDVQKILLAPRGFYDSRIDKKQFKEDWHLIKKKMTEEKGFYACYYRGEPRPEGKHNGHFSIHILKKSTLKKKKEYETNYSSWN